MWQDLQGQACGTMSRYEVQRTPTAEGKNEICDICKKAFGSRKGLSTHERLMHPAERNEKRAKAATNKLED